MAALAAALLVLLGPSVALEVTVSDPRTVALLFQPVRLRCHYRTASPDPPPIVTWKYKSFCPQSGAFGDFVGDNGGLGAGGEAGGGLGEAGTSCPDSARTVRIVATKQGDVVTLGDFYRGRSVTILGGAELSLGPAAWGDSGLYVCTVTSLSDLQGNNEASAQLLVLGSLPEAIELLPGGGGGSLPDWLFVALVALGVALVALALGVCWCQCCPHTCCCYLRCPCCPQRCCCPEALYLAGKAAKAGLYAPPHLALQPLGSSLSSHAPLLLHSDGRSLVSAPPSAPPSVLRYLEEQLEPRGRWEPLPRAGPPPSEISSLHEAEDEEVGRGSGGGGGPPRYFNPSPPTPPPPSRGRWRSEELLGGRPSPPSPPLYPPRSRPRSRSRDDLFGGTSPSRSSPPTASRKRDTSPPRRLRKLDAVSRESLVV